MTFAIRDGLQTLPQDYDRWMDLALSDQVKWNFARSMPKTPHSYMIKGKTVSEEIFALAYRVRRTWGVPGKFYGHTQLYLYHRDNPDVRFWCGDRTPLTAEILNIATDGVSYGPQDAPSTFTPDWAEYDEIGCWWDWRYRVFEEKDKVTLWKAVHHSVNAARPTLLDIGAGTGGSLDSRIAPSQTTLAVDPSQAMLNDLVEKYHHIKEIYPGYFGDWADQADPAKQARDVAVASLGSGSYLTPEEVKAAVRFARRVAVLTFYKDIPQHRLDLPPTHEQALRTAQGLRNAATIESDTGGFTYVVVVR